MAVTEARVTALEGDLKEVKEWINGNGKPGAKVQLNSLEKAQQTTDEKLDELCKKIDDFQKAIMGLIFTVIGALMIYILLNVIPHVAK